jgi:hypothetical protein
MSLARRAAHTHQTSAAGQFPGWLTAGEIKKKCLYFFYSLQ